VGYRPKNILGKQYFTITGLDLSLFWPQGHPWRDPLDLSIACRDKPL
jgi:hypothetical protein